MTSLNPSLARMAEDLQACGRGELPVAALAARWREASGALPLPARYTEVLGQLLDRLEAGALFSEESCSFSQSGLLQQLQAWHTQACSRLADAAA